MTEQPEEFDPLAILGLSVEDFVPTTTENEDTGWVITPPAPGEVSETSTAFSGEDVYVSG